MIHPRPNNDRYIKNQILYLSHASPIGIEFAETILLFII